MQNSFPCGSADKESACNAGDLGSIPWLGRFPGERKGYPLLYSGLESSMDCIVYEVAQRWTRLSNFHFHLVAQIVKNLPAMQETWVRSLGQEDPLEKGMVTHSSILSWRTPRTKEPGELQSTGPQRVRHDWASNTFTFRGPQCTSQDWDPLK